MSGRVTWEEYEIYASVVEAGSLSAAGRKLGLSTALVSKRLARLEDRLGVRLVSRTTRRLTVTDTGREFYDRAVAILESVAEAESFASGRSAPSRGVLRVSAPTSFGRLHLAPHLKPFLDAHPDLTLELDLTDSFVDLGEAGVDVAVRIGVMEPGAANAVWLAPNRRFLCAAPAYVAAHGAPGSLAELKRHRLLAASNQTVWRLIGPEGPVMLRVRSFVPTNSSDLVRELALSGVGIALRSTWDVNLALASGELQTVLPAYAGSAEVGIYALTRPVRSRSTPVQAFVGFLQDLFGPTPYWDEAPGTRSAA